MKKISTLFLAFAIVVSAHAQYSVQSKTPQAKDTTPNRQWYLLDPDDDKEAGISAIKAYNTILKNKKSRTIVVAVIDSGIDIFHEDMKDVIWTNDKEIAGNGVDDDKNGYPDDVHGWNFIGGADGKHVNNETLELTRLYKQYNDRFYNKDAKDITAAEQKDYALYQTIKKDYEKELQDAMANQQGFKTFYENFKFADSTIQQVLKKPNYTLDELKNSNEDDAFLKRVYDFMIYAMENGVSADNLDDTKQHFDDQVSYNLNTAFNPRDIVGDNPLEMDGKPYGNSDVKGPDSKHGTHVAGIIAAKRGNNLGVDGIADNVEIMVLRAVPNGDERDKDIANAIRYAADNGAQIINMSFGKAYSPQKQFVDDAVRYAEQKGVLMIHAAGNDAENNDKVGNFPHKYYIDGKGESSNWITVGASARYMDNRLAADFSNYGKKSVDFFAPGVDIYATTPENKYEELDGTSMACPVTTGVAALLMSYYPSLTATDVKAILMQSVVPYKSLKVTIPGGDKKIKFKKLSVTGGVVNAYKALQIAEKLTGSK